jgi:hypothetical protein
MLIKKLVDAGADTSNLSRSQTAALRAATREEIYNSSEEESMEEEKIRAAISFHVKSQPEYITHPCTEEDDFNNELLRATFDPHFDYELSSDSESKEDSADHSQHESSEALDEEAEFNYSIDENIGFEEENNHSTSEENDLLIDNRGTSPGRSWF